MEFLVEFEVHVPEQVPASEVEVQRAPRPSPQPAGGRRTPRSPVERRVAPGAAKPIGLYRAVSEAQLDGLLRALPLYDWMDVTVTPLEAHPNDPAPRATVPASRQELP